MPQSTTTSVDFIPSQSVGLQDGDYKIKVTQTIKKNDKETIGSFDTGEWSFSVSGDRFTLKPQDIYAVFPPEGSLGEHSNVLPHIILNRSTLPWERSIEGDRQDTPWLALLIFHEEEKLSGTVDQQDFIKELKKYTDTDGDSAWKNLLEHRWLTPIETSETTAVITDKSNRNSASLDQNFTKLETTVEAILNSFRTPQIVTLEKLKVASTGVIKCPAMTLESGQHDDDKVTIIDIPKKLLQQILPSHDDLPYLAHVRKTADSSTPGSTTETAVIIGNRLPKKRGISTVHLVSLENRYQGEEFDYQSAEDNSFIRLVSLKRWNFACVDEKQNFQTLLIHLNRDPSTLRLPPVTDKQAEHYLAMGYVPLPHHLRQGGKTISWYHSPLLPGENTSLEDPDILPSRAADTLLRYNPSNGLFDISYAAAWELGRLLALQSKDFSVNLYNWKRTHVQQLKQAEQQLLHSHLSIPSPSSDTLEIPNAITDWFTNLSLLKGVPFNYLVPDEKMLPPESIRFFWVDPLWIDCLLDGAFSIGRVATSDHQRDRSIVNQEKINPDHPPLPRNPAANPHDTITGFLLRSDVVAGWPGLLVDASSEIQSNEDPIPEDKQLKLLRMERLSPNVLLCLFAGEIKTVDIHQKPETLHFGLDKSSDDPTVFYKKLRDSEGKTRDQKISSIPWKDENKRVVDIDALVTAIRQQFSEAPFTSANFALQMIEGVEKVRFTLKVDDTGLCD